MKAAVVDSIDVDVTVTVERIPLKGETLKGEDIRYIPGGKGVNQAVAIARLGADVEMPGRVGGDEAGRGFIENMEDMGVRTTYVKVISGVNTGSAVTTVGDHDNTIVAVAGANDKVDREYADSMGSALLTCDIVLLQHEIPQDTIEYVIDICRENGVKVVPNPGSARPAKLKVLTKVGYLMPNEHEAAILFGDVPVEGVLRTHPGKLVIAQGSRGVSTCLPTRGILTVPVREANVVDTTGAGDILNGAFAVEITGGSAMEEALRSASAAASLSTERFEVQGRMLIRSQVLEAMNQKDM